MQITFRGPKTLIEQLTDTDVSVVVDLAGGQIGTFTVKGKVTLTSQFAACGAIKAESVSVTLRSTLEGQAE